MSPRTKQQNEQIREERRRQVLQAAVALFAQDGFDRTSTAAVAKAAGVSHGIVFFYFNTKEDLYRAAVLEPLGPTQELTRQLLAGPGSPKERVESLARLMLASFAREETYLLLIQQALRLKNRFKSVYDDLNAFTEVNATLLGNVIAEGQEAGEFLSGDPKRMAFFFFALINGCALTRTNEPGDLLGEDAVQAALRLITRP